MDRKIKNTIILSAVLLLLVLAGSLFSYVYQNKKIDERDKKVKDLKINEYDTSELMAQLDSLKIKAARLDSILALRKFNIPFQLKQSAFFDFITNVSADFSDLSFVNIEYAELVREKHFNYYVYKLTGIATYNDLYKMVYAIEQGKELKKITSSEMSNIVTVDDESVPHFLVNYTLRTLVYFSDNDRFASAAKMENKLTANSIYDIFFPLIRKEIPPNTDNLLDVQTATLLALLPDGAFLSDASGNTFMLWEGDEVYLGYLTKIDYKQNKVYFILNKGGIVEKVNLVLQKENTIDMTKSKKSK